MNIVSKNIVFLFKSKNKQILNIVANHKHFIHLISNFIFSFSLNSTEKTKKDPQIMEMVFFRSLLFSNLWY